MRQGQVVSNSCFQSSATAIPPEKRTVRYAVFDALHKLPSGNNMPEKQAETDQSVSAVPGARVMKNFDAGGVPSQCAAKMAAFPVSVTMRECQLPHGPRTECGGVRGHYLTVSGFSLEAAHALF